MTCIVKVKKTHPDAKLPVQEKGDVGWDLFAIESGVITAGTTGMIHTGLTLAETPIETDPYKRVLIKVEGRSGLALKKSVFPVGGIIDPYYRGEICALLYNGGKEDFWYEPGDRVAQIVLYPVHARSLSSGTKFVESDVIHATDRGTKGFGSSGK